MTFTNSLPWHQRAQAPAVSAVYGFFNAAGEVLYVGKSRNLKNRMQDHHRSGEVSSDAALKWFEVPEQDLDKTEQQLIELHRPELNFSHFAPGRSSYEGLDRNCDGRFLPTGEGLKSLNMRVKKSTKTQLQRQADDAGLPLSIYCRQILESAAQP